MSRVFLSLCFSVFDAKYFCLSYRTSNDDKQVFENLRFFLFHFLWFVYSKIFVEKLVKRSDLCSFKTFSFPEQPRPISLWLGDGLHLSEPFQILNRFIVQLRV